MLAFLRPYRVPLAVAIALGLADTVLGLARRAWAEADKKFQPPASVSAAEVGQKLTREFERVARVLTVHQQREKVIVRSNGVVTYVGKDIANQFWKLGLLGRDFRYRRFLERYLFGVADFNETRRRVTRWSVAGSAPWRSRSLASGATTSVGALTNSRRGPSSGKPSTKASRCLIPQTSMAAVRARSS